MRRIIDSKFHIEGDKIIKTSNGEVVPEDEPTFIFRARDRLALSALLRYRDLCILDGCTDYQLDKLNGMINQFESFAENNPSLMKQPGVTRGL